MKRLLFRQTLYNNISFLEAFIVNYFFDIRKLKKIIFGFLIIFSFFQVCSDSFAGPSPSPHKSAEKEEVKKVGSPKPSKNPTSIPTQATSSSNIQEQPTKQANSFIDNLPLIISILSILLNLIFITLYFIGKKNLNAKITKLSSKIKNQNTINEKNTENFVNTNKYIMSFEKNFDNVQTEINHINKDIISMQNSINEKNRAKSLRDELRKDDNPYQEEEIKKPISPIKNLCNKHAEMQNREFIKNYPNAIKLDITNAEDVVYRNNDPIFQETDQGKYIAIALPELENSNHYLFYAKGTNITSEDIALKTVFSFDKEYEKAQIYSDWKILEPAILNMNNNNWQIFKKGKIEL